MKKSLALFRYAPLYLFAQIGINTDQPKATLDVTAKKEVLTIDGLLPPRLTRAELTEKGNTLYGKDQDGIIIYINDISGGDNQSQREFIESKGLYILMLKQPIKKDGGCAYSAMVLHKVYHFNPIKQKRLPFKTVSLYLFI
jgi:hypothetical protein